MPDITTLTGATPEPLTAESLANILLNYCDDWAKIGLKVEHDANGKPTRIFLIAWADSANPVHVHEFNQFREVHR